MGRGNFLFPLQVNHMAKENTFFYILLAVVVIGFAIPFVQAYYYKNKSRGNSRAFTQPMVQRDMPMVEGGNDMMDDPFYSDPVYKNLPGNLYHRIDE